ncbi:MAG: BTAD domain-containing putative transcriptional regulator [Ktedonobacterales bacterium]
MSESVPLYHSQAPAAWSPLIGRDQDLEAIEHLQSQQRLVTLWGPGGSGKTRLAMQIAAQVQESFADGVRFVACADLHDPDLLVLHVATTLGLHVQNDRVPIDAVMAWLHSRHLLLVIDNCEHLLAACTTLVDELLARCPHLHVLMTSRELLGLPTEQAYPVRPLALPPPEQVHGLHSHAHRYESLEDIQRLGTYSGIQLFVQRAQMAQPDFTLTQENATQIVTICRLLDGLPLAIELVAARVRMLALEQLAERLTHDNAILGSGNRLAPPRQQTLQATITWSYQLLTPPEQQLFRRLALATSSFDLSLAEALGDGIAGTASDSVDLLGHLIDKSLVTVVVLEGTARYRLLDTLRHYGREQLQQLGETEATYQRYAGWVRRVTEQAGAELHGPQQGAWFDRLEAEIEHIRTVIRWLLQQREAAEVVRISAALVAFCEYRPHAREATQWLHAAVAGDGAIEPAQQAKAFCALGVLTIRQAPADQVQEYLIQAQEYLIQAQELYAQLDDQAGMADALSNLGYLQFWLADYHAAQAYLEAGLAIVPNEALNLKAVLLHRLGITHCRRGDLQHAIGLLRKSLTVRRQLVDISGLAITLAVLGGSLRAQGDYGQAQQYLRESLQHFADVGARDEYVYALVNLYDVALALEDPTLSQDYLAAALSSTWADCDMGLLGQLFERLARMALLQRRPMRAVQLFGYAAALDHEPSDQLPDSVRVQVQHMTAHVKLPAVEMNAAWHEGQQMGLEEAFSFALKDSEADIREQQNCDHDEVRRVVTASSASSPENNATHRISVTPLRIEALGGGTVYRDDSQAGVTWHYSKACELFFYLVGASHRTKAQICLALWPDAPAEQASTHMRVTLHHLRKTLGDAPWVPHTNAGYAFNYSLPYSYDVQKFESVIAQAQTVQQTMNAADVQKTEMLIALLAEACALYRGDYLLDLPPQEWILPRQTELRQHYIDAQYRLGEAYQRLGDTRQALASYQRVTAGDPYHERAHAMILHCYVHLGERSKAIGYYRDLQHYLRNELGVTPDPHITSFVRTLLAQGSTAS